MGTNRSGSTASSGPLDSDAEKDFRTAFRRGKRLRIRIHTKGETVRLTDEEALQWVERQLQGAEDGDVRLTLLGQCTAL